MSCTQLKFDVPVFNGKTMSDETKRVTLTKMSAVHLVQEDPCSAPIQVCIKRVVKCQKGCYFEEILHDFPIDSADPLLPPGEYEISVPETSIPLFNGVSSSVSVIFEDVTAEYVQARLVNSRGGCC